MFPDQKLKFSRVWGRHSSSRTRYGNTGWILLCKSKQNQHCCKTRVNLALQNLALCITRVDLALQESRKMLMCIQELILLQLITPSYIREERGGYTTLCTNFPYIFAKRNNLRIRRLFLCIHPDYFHYVYSVIPQTNFPCRLNFSETNIQ